MTREMTPDIGVRQPPRAAVQRTSLLGTAALAILIVIAAGVLNLAMPFWGDQALFTIYARQLSEGAVLYRDVFDVKQPGIFAFYTVGGLLFGFTEIGIHLLELLYWLAFTAFVLVALRPYFSSRWGIAAVPVFTVAVYYLSARVYELTQIEILVAFPLLAAWWLVTESDPAARPGRRRYAAAGLLAATVVVFKHLYVVIIAGFVVYAVVRARRRGTAAPDIARSVAAFCVALVVPLLLVAAYFAAHGQLDRIWWGYVEYAAGSTARVPRPLTEVAGGARQFMIGHAPLLILAAVGCLASLRRRTPAQADLVAGMLSWCVLGAAAFWVQLWGEYKWMLFTVPLGVLAALGAEALAVARRRPHPLTLVVGGALALGSFLAGAAGARAQTLLLLCVLVGVGAAIATQALRRGPRAPLHARQVVGAALAVAIGLTAIAPATKVRELARHDFALTAESRTDFQHSWYPPYRSADEDLATLARGDVLPGPMHVFGHPIVLLRAGRAQAAAIPGWTYEIFDDRAWRELHEELRAARPPYIVVAEDARAMIRRRYPALLDFLRSEYEIAFTGSSGTWHVRARGRRRPSDTAHRYGVPVASRGATRARA